MYAGSGMDSFGHDLRHAVRGLRRAPGFTAVAVLTLALGIGATTAIFSVVNAVLLRLLPYPASREIVSVYQIIPRPRLGTPLRGGLTPDQLQLWRNRARAVSEVAAYESSAMTLTGVPEAVRLNGARVTASLFPLLGVAPMMGRTFTAADERPAAEAVIVLSHAAWISELGADAEALDRLLTLDGEPYRVVGVMPPVFTFPRLDSAYRTAGGGLDDAPQFWVPITLGVPNPNPTRDVNLVPTLARIDTNAGLAQAEAEAQTLIPAVRDDLEMQVDLVPLQEELVAPVRTPLLILQAAVGFLLLIACANVTNLLLARGASRRREVAVRVAIGGGRSQVVRASLAESLLLALAGGGLGCVLAVWGTRLLRALPPGTIPRVGETTVDATVLGLALALSVLTGLAVGLVVAGRISRADPLPALRDGGAGRHGGAIGRPSSVLAVGQVAAATVLLAGAALLANSFVRQLRLDPGFDADNVLTFRLTLPQQRYPDVGQQALVYAGLLDALATIPGVDSVALGNSLPFQSSLIGGPVVIDGERAEPPFAAYRLLAADYFRSLRVPRARRPRAEGGGPDGTAGGRGGEPGVRASLLP